MLHQDVDVEDLRNEIFNLRKHIARFCSENQILKVKIKKLQDEMIRRDKQLDEFLHSKKCFGLSKNLQEKGASVILNLKLKNDKLEQMMLEKDLTIKRLQNTLQTAKLYNANSLTKKFASKAVECTLLPENKLEFCKKSKHHKIDLYMPNFFDENEENVAFEKEEAAIEKKAGSELPLDVKKSTTHYSKVRYESHAKNPQINDVISEQVLEDEISTLPENFLIGDQIEEIRTSENSFMNPTFQKILQSVEELMRRGSAEVNVSRKISIDEAIQFPQETNPENPDENLQMEDPETQFENERPPTLVETLVADQCDAENIINNPEKQQTIIINEMPHEEIKQLQVHLMDMICQVDNLKDTIFQLKTDQKNTQSCLKSKDENIEKLAKEIKQLRDLQSTASEKENLIVPNPNIEPAEKDGSVETQQKTKKHSKSKAGKLKRPKNTNSKSSIPDQSGGKLSRSSSKHKPEKCISGEDPLKKKYEKKTQNTSEPKTVFGIGNGDVVDIPYYKCNLVQNCDTKNNEKIEFDELD